MTLSRTTFRSFTADVLSPTVLRGQMGERLMVGTIGLIFDMIAESCRQAVKSWMITSREFPSDALPLMGEARRLPRYQNEGDDGYKFRIYHAFETWAQAGSPQSVKQHLELSFGVTVQIEENHTWNWDGDVSKHARAWFIVRGHGFGGANWGESGRTWGNTFTWGSNATLADVRDYRAVVHQWKPAHVRPFIVMVFDEAGWDADTPPDGTWGPPNSRSTAAFYWEG